MPANTRLLSAQDRALSLICLLRPRVASVSRIPNSMLDLWRKAAWIRQSSRSPSLQLKGTNLAQDPCWPQQNLAIVLVLLVFFVLLRLLIPVPSVVARLLSPHPCYFCFPNKGFLWGSTENESCVLRLYTLWRNCGWWWWWYAGLTASAETRFLVRIRSTIPHQFRTKSSHLRPVSLTRHGHWSVKLGSVHWNRDSWPFMSEINLVQSFFMAPKTCI